MKLDLDETKILVNSFLGLLNQFGKSKTPAIADLEEVFSPHLRITRNRQPICTHLSQLIDLMTQLQRELTQFEYTYKDQILEIDEEEGSRAAIYFEIEGERVSEKIYCQVSASLRIQERKIVEWNEVLYTKGIGRNIFNYSE